MRFGLLYVALILSHFLMSCADQHLAYDQLIVGGVKLKDADEISSHLVNINVPDQFGRSEVCTGVFISSQAILTVAHCVSEKLSDLSITFRPANYASTGTVVNLTAVDSKNFRAENDIREDLVVLYFFEQIPKEAKIAKIAKIDNLDVDASFSVAGYGMHAKKIDVMNTRLIYGDKPRMKDILISNVTKYRNYFVIDQKMSNGGVCAGDSGGPAFYMDLATKQMQLIGIASAVRQEDTASNCLKESYIIKTDFLKGQVE